MERLKSGLLGDQDLMYPWREYFEQSIRIKTVLDDALRRDVHSDLEEFNFFLVLSDAPDCSMRLTDMAERLVFSFSRLNYRVNQLVERGLLVKEACPNDRRSHRVTMTEKGLEHFIILAKAHERHLMKIFDDQVGRQELEELQDLTKKFNISRLQ